MRLLLILAAALVAMPAWSQETGALKARFVYGGPAPTPQPIVVNKDVAFCGNARLTSERLLVNTESGGIKNVVLFVYTGRGGSKLPPQPKPGNSHDLVMNNCRFEPHISIVQAGDTLRLTSPDAVAHNANLNFFANAVPGGTRPPGASMTIKIEKPEPAAIPVDCNIHPWMRAYVVALDHPFAGISDDHGLIEIKDLPAEELVFRLFVESADGPIKEVLIEGKVTPLKSNNLTLMIKPGENDLGTITIPAAALKP